MIISPIKPTFDHRFFVDFSNLKLFCQLYKSSKNNFIFTISMQQINQQKNGSMDLFHILSCMQGSPIYAVFTTAIFGLCTLKLGIFALVGNSPQSHSPKVCVTCLFSRPKIRVKWICRKLHIQIIVQVEIMLREFTLRGD